MMKQLFSYILFGLGVLALCAGRPVAADPLFDTDDVSSASDLFAPPDSTGDSSTDATMNPSFPTDQNQIDQNQPIIPGQPTYNPEQQPPPKGGKTRVSNLFWDVAGGAAGIGLIVALTSSGGSNTSHQHGPPPVPEFSSLAGLALLGMPGIFVLARSRRRRA